MGGPGGPGGSDRPGGGPDDSDWVKMIQSQFSADDLLGIIQDTMEEMLAQEERRLSELRALQTAIIQLRQDPPSDPEARTAALQALRDRLAEMNPRDPGPGPG